MAAWQLPVTIRLAGAGDEPAIARVAGRDSGTAPPSPRLLAERDGIVVAAISLRTGELVADPFVRTAELVELLRCHLAGVRLADEPERANPNRGRVAGRLDLGLSTGGCA